MTDEQALTKLLMPYAISRIEDLGRNNTRLVHYTSAETALKILTPASDGMRYVWMRNSQTMNDASEVLHGQGCLAEAYNDMDGSGGKLKILLDNIMPGLWNELTRKLSESNQSSQFETYLLSLSEHRGGEEDSYGRLSMWRAYGGTTGVALVFNNGVFLSESTALNAYTTPVLYGDATDFRREFYRVVKNLEGAGDLLRRSNPLHLLFRLIETFRYAVLSTKHPGFREEMEWRVIYSPMWEPSEVLVPEIVSLGGVPQRVYKIPLKDRPQDNFYGAEVPGLIERIIIGPTPYPWQVRDAFIDALELAGVTDASSRVFVSLLPLRC